MERPRGRAGGERGGWPRRCSVLKVKLPQAPPAPGHVVVAARPPASALCSRSQAVSGWNPQAPGPALGSLSEEILWGCQRLTQPLLCSDHSCLLASFGWKSPPHDGLPGKSVFSSRRAHRIRDCGNIPRFWKLRSKKLNGPPAPSSFPSPSALDFPARPHSLPVVPALP